MLCHLASYRGPQTWSQAETRVIQRHGHARDPPTHMHSCHTAGSLARSRAHSHSISLTHGSIEQHTEPPSCHTNSTAHRPLATWSHTKARGHTATASHSHGPARLQSALRLTRGSHGGGREKGVMVKHDVGHGEGREPLKRVWDVADPALRTAWPLGGPWRAEMSHGHRTYLGRVWEGMGVRQESGQGAGRGSSHLDTLGHLPVPLLGSRPTV